MLASTLGLVLTVTSETGVAGFTVFRSLRLFRVLTVLTARFSSFQRVLNCLRQSATTLLPLCMLLALFIFVFALLGMQLFGPMISRASRSNFAFLLPGQRGHGYGALLTMFQILTGENWNEIMYRAICDLETSDFFPCTDSRMAGALFFFVAVMCLGVYFLLNLFVAVLTDGFAVHGQGNADDDDEIGIVEQTSATLATTPNGSTSSPADGAAQNDHILDKVHVPHVPPAITMVDDDGEAWHVAPEALFASDQTVDKVNSMRQMMESSSAPRKGREASCCGHIYDAASDGAGQPFEQLPDTWRCPVCGEPKAVYKSATGAHGSVQWVHERKTTSGGLTIDIDECRAQNEVSMLSSTLRTTQSTPSMHDHMKAKKQEGFDEAILSMQAGEEQFRQRGKALGCIPTSNIVRRAAHCIAKNRWFKGFIMVAIIVASASLAIQDPSVEPQPLYYPIVDASLTLIFSFELVIKVLDQGFIRAPYCYMRNPFNVLDFAVVVVGCVELMGETHDALKSLKSLRAVRVLRPLRLVSHNEGMRMAIMCILSSLPSMVHVTIVCFLIFLIFAIMGSSLFVGRFYACRSADDWTSERLGTFTALGTNHSVNDWLDCAGARGSWLKPFYHFDSVVHSLSTLANAATFESWLEPLDSALDARGVGQMPEPMSDPVVPTIFFVVCLTISGHFIVNVFTALMVDNYRRLKANYELISSKQAIWVDTMYFALAHKPVLRRRPGKGMWRRPFFRIIESSLFERIVTVAIVVQLMVLLTLHIDESDSWKSMQEMSAALFAVLFSVEAALCICALSFRQYIGKTRTLLEAVLVLLSWIIFVVKYPDRDTELRSRHEVLKELLNWLRCVRVLLLSWRLVGLNRHGKGMRLIFGAIVGACPAILNLGGLLLLLLIVYAILGNNLFWNVADGNFINSHANFRDFPTSMITLLRVLTGEAWPGLHADCSRSVCYREVGSMAACGGTFVSGLYFYTFILLGSFTLLNLFVAVILEQIEAVQRMRINPLKPQGFALAWMEFDPEAMMLMPYDKLEQFMMRLGPPMGFPHSTHKLQRQRVLLQIQIPCQPGSLLAYVDVLEHLSRLALGVTELPNVKHLRALESKYEGARRAVNRRFKAPKTKNTRKLKNKMKQKLKDKSGTIQMRRSVTSSADISTMSRAATARVRFENGEAHSYTAAQLQEKFGVAADQVKGGTRLEHRTHGLGTVEMSSSSLIDKTIIKTFDALRSSVSVVRAGVADTRDVVLTAGSKVSDSKVGSTFSGWLGKDQHQTGTHARTVFAEEFAAHLIQSRWRKRKNSQETVLLREKVFWRMLLQQDPKKMSREQSDALFDMLQLRYWQKALAVKEHETHEERRQRLGAKEPQQKDEHAAALSCDPSTPPMEGCDIAGGVDPPQSRNEASDWQGSYDDGCNDDNDKHSHGNADHDNSIEDDSTRYDCASKLFSNCRCKGHFTSLSLRTAAPLTAR